MQNSKPAVPRIRPDSVPADYAGITVQSVLNIHNCRTERKIKNGGLAQAIYFIARKRIWSPCHFMNGKRARL